MAGHVLQPSFARAPVESTLAESAGYALYGALGIALLVPGLVVAGAGAALRPRWRPGFAERLGKLPEGIERVRERPVRVWVHCASIGEVRAAHPLLAAVAERRPDVGMLLTTTTPEGNRTARSLGLAQAVGMLPADLPGLPGRLFDAALPDALVLLETELWPGLLRAARKRFVPSLVVNGRISARSFGRYRLAGGLLEPVLRDVTAFAMQAEVDRDRILALGADPSKVETFGNLKYDALALPAAAPPDALAALRGKPVWVAGSTHEGEEGAVADAFVTLRASIPGLRLVVAPRHLQRADPAETALTARGLKVVRRSRLAGPVPDDAVVLLDTSGELVGTYGLATAVFVGGSLVPKGGHNPLEPLAHGKPVAFGPFTHNFRDVTEVVLGSGGARRVADPAALAEAMRPWLAEPDDAARAGSEARARILSRHGAVERAMTLLERWIGPRPAPVRPPRPERGEDWLGMRERNAAVRAAAGAVAAAYAGAVRVRRTLYDGSALPTHAAGVPVISVGGIAAGGTGKTPAVIHLARLLAARGRHVAVVSRGYGGRPGSSPLFVSSGAWSGHDPHHTLPGADRAGDEPLLIARRAPEAAVVVHPDRVAAARAAVAHGADVVVLDDGFQHRRLRRDLDVVLLDAASPFGNGRMLPAGPLRDLPARLADAGAVILTRADAAGPGACARSAARISLATSAPVVRFAHRVDGFAVAAPGEKDPRARLDASALAEHRPYAFAGVASPDAFFESLRRAGVRLAGEHPFPDHHPYDEDDVRELEKQAEAAGTRMLVTTEKDAVRLPLGMRMPVAVAGLAFEPLDERDAAALDRVLDRVLERGPR